MRGDLCSQDTTRNGRRVEEENTLATDEHGSNTDKGKKSNLRDHQLVGILNVLAEFLKRELPKHVYPLKLGVILTPIRIAEDMYERSPPTAIPAARRRFADRDRFSPPECEPSPQGYQHEVGGQIQFPKSLWR